MTTEGEPASDRSFLFGNMSLEVDVAQELFAGRRVIVDGNIHERVRVDHIANVFVSTEKDGSPGEA